MTSHSGTGGSPMQGLEDGEATLKHAGITQDTLYSSSIDVDIYDLDTVQKLQKDPNEDFFSRYAKGDWTALHPNEIPLDIEVEMLPAVSSAYRSSPPIHSNVGHYEELNASHSGGGGLKSNNARGNNMHIEINSSRSGETPDLTQSVEDMYRSFISDRRRTSHSDVLPTPLMEANGFHFDTVIGDKKRASRIDSVSMPLHSPDGYAAHHARRFLELGYLEAPMPANELQRRKALRALKPFQTKLDPNLDRIAELGKSIFATNSSFISLVDVDEVYITSDGRDPYMVPRGKPLCSHALLLQSDTPLVVLDTLKDWRFKENKAVVVDSDVRFYAGCSMQTEDGENIGVVCVFDNRPRTDFGKEQQEQLKELTDMVYMEYKRLINQKQKELQDRLQNSLQAFNREAVSGSYTTEYLLRRIVEHISYALSVEGVLIFDALGVAHAQSVWYDHTGQSIPVMAASEHATHLSEMRNPYTPSNSLERFLSDYPKGFLYTQGDELPSAFMNLLPESVTAAAAIPVTRGRNEPYALICVYTLRPDYYFQLPDAVLSFLNSMGLILCGVQQHEVLSLADKAKIDFISSLSHEIRTPLHGVIASCDLLAETNLSDTQESFLSTAKHCAGNLTEIINHVLDFTKSTSQATEHRREAVDLSLLIEETMVHYWLGQTPPQFSSDSVDQVDHNPKIAPKVEPLIEIEPSNNWTVMVDKAGLRRILANLVGNSMKFTQEGYIKLRLSRQIQTNPSSIPIEIVVEDTGSGMSGKFIRERLFHPFSQEKPLSQGIGLGLAIVRAILQYPGIDGSIDVQSQVGKGTRVTIRFEAPIVPESTPVPWFECPYPVKENNFPPITFLGFPASRRGPYKLAELIRQQLTRWYGPIHESNPQDAKILIINADNVTLEFLSEPQRRHQKLLLLASSPIDKHILKAAQEIPRNGGFCLVNLKPIGPHGLSKLITSILNPSFVKSISPSPPSTSRISSPTYLPNKKRKNSINGTSNMRIAKRKLSSDGFSLVTPIEGPIMPRALVVEDNVINRKVLSAYLRKRGYEYMEASNGEEGVNIFDKYPSGHFDICLMDLQMPVMDGFNATAMIRQIERRRMESKSNSNAEGRLVVYALSGLAAPEDKERAVTIGFDGYLVKPVSFQTLDDVFQSLPPIARWRALP